MNSYKTRYIGSHIDFKIEKIKEYVAGCVIGPSTTLICTLFKSKNVLFHGAMCGLPSV